MKLFIIFVVSFAIGIYSSYLLYAYQASLTQQQRGEIALPKIYDDSLEYTEIAENLSQGKGFTLRGEPNYFRTPTYPLFLAASLSLFRSFWPAIILQVILTFATGLILYLFGKNFLPSFAAAFAGLYYILHPAVLLYSSVTMTDTFFIFFLMSSLLLGVTFLRTERVMYGLVAAVALSIAILTRPIAICLAFPAIGVLYYVLYIKNRQQLAAHLCAIALLALPLLWSYRNYQQSGVYSLTSLTSYNFLAYNLANFEAQKKGITREAVLSEYEQKLGLSGQQMFDLQHSSVLSEFTLSKLNSSWLDYTVYHVSRSAAFILTPVLPDFLKRIDPTAIENIELPRIEPIISLVWFLFASYFIYKNKKSPYTWLCAGLILYFALLVGPVVIPRYKLQTEPFLILLAAGGLYAACKTTLSFYSNSKFQSMTSFLPLQKAKRQD